MLIAWILRFFSYRIAQAGILKAIPRLHALGLTTKRPDDYFAEMAKSDSHMKRVMRDTSIFSRNVENIRCINLCI